MSQGIRKKFVRTFRKSLRKRGVFLVLLDVGFGLSKWFLQSEVLGEVCVLESGSSGAESGRSFWRSLGRSFWQSFRGSGTFRAKHFCNNCSPNSHGSAKDNWLKSRENPHDQNICWFSIWFWLWEKWILTKETWFPLLREWKFWNLQWEQFLPRPGSP